MQQMLEAAGIHCHTFNEHAAGGLGELAATAVWPEVWIVREQQFSLARSIIEEYESAPEKNIDCGAMWRIQSGHLRDLLALQYPSDRP